MTSQQKRHRQRVPPSSITFRGLYICILKCRKTFTLTKYFKKSPSHNPEFPFTVRNQFNYFFKKSHLCSDGVLKLTVVVHPRLAFLLGAIACHVGVVVCVVGVQVTLRIAQLATRPDHWDGNVYQRLVISILYGVGVLCKSWDLAPVASKSGWCKHERTPNE